MRIKWAKSSFLHKTLQGVIEVSQCLQSLLLRTGTIALLISPIGDQFIFDFVEKRRTSFVSTGQFVAVLCRTEIRNRLGKHLSCFVGFLQALVDLVQRRLCPIGMFREVSAHVIGDRTNRIGENRCFPRRPADIGQEERRHRTDWSNKLNQTNVPSRKVQTSKNEWLTISRILVRCIVLVKNVKNDLFPFFPHRLIQIDVRCRRKQVYTAIYPVNSACVFGIIKDGMYNLNKAPFFPYSPKK